jgi:2,3-bisphosphoglycerate-dependent phosphoglycerate mutase
MKLYLARHGETDWNAERRLQGRIDISLNNTGKDQARELAFKLQSIQLEAIYCSALQRSIETAQFLDRKPVLILPELNEQALGKYEGMQLEGDNLVQFQKRRSDPDDSLDGGESRNEHRTRIRAALHLIRAAHSENSQVLVIGHGGTNSVILKELFDLQTDLMFSIGNSDLFLIDLPVTGSPTLWKYVTIQ